MAITRVQSASNNASATSVVVTLGSAPSASNVLLAVVETQGTTAGATSVTSTGHTWTKDKEVVYPNDAGTNAHCTQLWRGTGGTGTAVTFNRTGSANIEAAVYEYSGLGTGAPEVTASTTGYNDGEFPTGDQDPATGTTAVNSTANSLAFGGCGCQVPGVFTTTNPTGEATAVETKMGSGNTSGLVVFEGIETSTAAMNGNCDFTSQPLTHGLGGVIGVYAEAAATAIPTRTLMGVGL